MNDQPIPEIRFIVDAMFGSLARWLRFLGYDTWFCATQSDYEILEHASGRILLTRDKELIDRAQRRGIIVFNPGHQSIRSMLQKLQDRYRLQFVADPFSSRCPECNSPLRMVNGKEVINQVPPKSLRRHDIYWLCTKEQCQKVYWQGRHWKRIKKTLSQLKPE